MSTTDIGIKKFFLTFTNRRLEKRFKQGLAKKSKRYTQIVYVLLLIIAGIFTLVDGLVGSDSKLAFIRLGILLVLVAAGGILLTRYFEQKYEHITMGVSPYYIAIIY